MPSPSRDLAPVLAGLSLLGVAAFAAPIVLARQNPSGITVGTAYSPHSGEAALAVLRASDIAPDASLHAEATSVEGGVVQLGLGPVCVQSGLHEGTEVTLTGVRPLAPKGSRPRGDGRAAAS